MHFSLDFLRQKVYYYSQITTQGKYKASPPTKAPGVRLNITGYLLYSRIRTMIPSENTSAPISSSTRICKSSVPKGPKSVFHHIVCSAHIPAKTTAITTIISPIDTRLMPKAILNFLRLFSLELSPSALQLTAAKIQVFDYVKHQHYVFLHFQDCTSNQAVVLWSMLFGTDEWRSE